MTPATTTETCLLDPDDLRPARERAAEVLREGGLVVAPTDTVYGVLADVRNPDAVDRLYAARGADRAVPPTVVLHNPRSVAAVAPAVPETAERLMASYWPGPVTLVLDAAPDLDWALGDAREAVALRMPAEPVLLQILYDVGPLACSAAARAGAEPPTTMAEARAALGEAVDLYLDGGSRSGAQSTIVDARATPAVLRAGAVDEADVRTVVGGALDWGQRPGDTHEAPDAGAGPASHDAVPASEAAPAGDPAAPANDRVSPPRGSRGQAAR